MKSNANNIDNPMKRIDIDLSRTEDCYFRPTAYLRAQPVTQDFYDSMGQHDPSTIYIITNADDGRYYIGDILVIPERNTTKYCMRINENNEYTICIVETDDRGDMRMLNLYSYNNPQAAINELHRLKKCGSHSTMAMEIYTCLTSYITKENGINETILAILSCTNYGSSPKLQYLIERGITYGVKNGDRDLPAMYKNDIRIEPSFPSLVKIYADIYDVFVLHEFFNDPKYSKGDPTDLDLSDAVKRIETIIYDNMYHDFFDSCHGIF